MIRRIVSAGTIIILAYGGCMEEAEQLDHHANNILQLNPLLIAGHTPTTVTDKWSSHPIPKLSLYTPVLVAQLDSYNGGDTAGLRFRNVSNTQFDVRVEEEQSKNSETSHTKESVSYIALRRGDLLDEDGRLVGTAETIRLNANNRNSWHTIEDPKKEFVDPIAIGQIVSHNGNHPSHIRVRRNIHTNLLEIQIEEWEYLDGAHTYESVSYLIVEKGTHTLKDGHIIFATEAEINHNWHHVAIPDLGKPPIILSQSQTIEGGESIVTRHRNTTQTSVEIRLQEEETPITVGHRFERTGIIAIGKTTTESLPIEWTGVRLFSLTEDDDCYRRCESNPIRDVALGDFNNDGITDLAADNRVLVNGVATQIKGFDGNQDAVSLADMNGDGHLDLISLTDGKTITVLLGDRNGSFDVPNPLNPQPQPRLPDAAQAQAFALADVNHDAHPDVILASKNGINVLLGRGNGQLDEAPEQSFAGNELADLAAGDFDNDGKVDVAVIHAEENAASILLGDGEGRFEEKELLPLGISPSAIPTRAVEIVATDVNHDSMLDIVTAGTNGYGTMISIRLGGNFSQLIEIPINTSYGFNEMSLGDLDEDGNVDIVVTNQADNLYILSGDGSGNFRLRNSHSLGLSFTTSSLDLIDINNDEHLDLVAAHRDNIAIVLGNGTLNLTLGNN